MILPVYVKCVNGCLYKNPILWGDNWFIKFDGTSLPKVFINRKPSVKPIEQVREVLDGLNVRYSIDETITETREAFPPNYTQHHDVIMARFELFSLLPYPQAWEEVLSKKEKIKGGYVLYEGNDSRWCIESSADEDSKVFPHVVANRGGVNVAKFKSMTDASLFVKALTEAAKNITVVPETNGAVVPESIPIINQTEPEPVSKEKKDDSKKTSKRRGSRKA